jgi:preprotein translocase SecF subunit
MTVYPLMRYRWWFICALGAVTAFALIMVFVVGLNYGIDFKGGVRVEIKLTQPTQVNDVRAAFSGAGVAGPVVQSLGSDSFLVTAESMTDAQFKAALETLKPFGAQESATGMEIIGPSFGKELEQKVLLAILIDFLVLIAYISWRFQFKFAIPAIIALFHDVGLILGLYAVTGRIVTAATVAAVLTILGYSMHDTIIVFDRIRENQALLTREKYSYIVDLSIRQTLARSINTSVTAMLPIAAILLFGGVTLKDFAFALTIGIFTGTYSSFFVASPLLTLWKEREPAYRKRALESASK